jgi:hypothetical protein
VFLVTFSKDMFTKSGFGVIDMLARGMDPDQAGLRGFSGGRYGGARGG